MDRELISTLTEAPMPVEQWRALLTKHEQFVRRTRPSSGSSWQVIDVSGLPLALWNGGQDDDQLNLRFGNLAGLSLDGALLIAAGLAGVAADNVSFRGARLKLALLADARLDGANFEGAELDLADFSRASLRGANLRNVTGSETDFENCDLTGADFTGSELLRPKLRGAVLDGVKGLRAS